MTISGVSLGIPKSRAVCAREQEAGRRTSLRRTCERLCSRTGTGTGTGTLRAETELEDTAPRLSGVLKFKGESSVFGTSAGDRRVPMRATKSPTNEPKSASPGAVVVLRWGG